MFTGYQMFIFCLLSYGVGTIVGRKLAERELKQPRDSRGRFRKG